MSTPSATEQIARDILAANGEPDPHPDLLADTVREVEYHGATGVQESLPPLPEYTVDKNTYDVPCTHPLCYILHKNLPWDHEWTRTEWVILENGSREGWVGDINPFERKRDAVAYLAKHLHTGADR